MQVLIQDIGTKRFFSADGHWVNSAREAQNFYLTVAAYDKGRGRIKGPFRIVFHFPETDYSIQIMDVVDKAPEKVATN